MKRLTVVFILMLFMSSCMISPYESEIITNEKNALAGNAQENNFVFTGIAEGEVNLDKSNAPAYNASLFGQIHDDIITNLTSNNTRPIIFQPYNDKYYDTLPGSEVLDLSDQSEIEDFKRILGEPTASLHASNISIYEWQYKLAGGDLICVNASCTILRDNTGKRLLTHVSEPHLLRIQLYVINELLKVPDLLDETKRAYETKLLKLKSDYTDSMKVFCEAIVKDVEQFCGHEVPLIYDEEYAWTLYYTLSEALHDYYSKNLNEK